MYYCVPRAVLRCKARCPGKIGRVSILSNVPVWISALHLRGMGHRQVILGRSFLSVRWGVICRAATLPLLRTHRLIWGPGEGVYSGTFPEQSPSPPPALQSQEGRRAISKAVALGNLNPLQREGFAWLRLCTHPEEASQSGDQPPRGPGPTERPDDWKPAPWP